jgi:hypothetical protein
VPAEGAVVRLHYLNDGRPNVAKTINDGQATGNAELHARAIQVAQ